MPRLVLLNEDLANTYKPVKKLPIEETVNKITITIQNKHATNSLKYQILAYPDKEDDSTTVTLFPETTLPANSIIVQTLTDAWDAILIQAKNATADVISTAKIVVNWV